MIRKILVTAGTAAVLVLGVPAAHATVDPEACQNFASPVIISNGYDPLHLDTDHDGIACEGNPGEPVKTDLYADLRGEDPSASPSTSTTPSPSTSETITPGDSPTLAHTGAGDLVTRHPLRSIGLGVVLVGAGAALVLVTRRRHG
jgi:hypothetical protein